MAAEILVNDYVSTLASPITSSSSLSCEVTSVTGPIGTLPASGTYRIRITDPVNAPGAEEIIKVDVARSGTTLSWSSTANRGDGGSTPQSWLAGATVEAVPTKEALEQLVAGVTGADYEVRAYAGGVSVLVNGRTGDVTSYATPDDARWAAVNAMSRLAAPGGRLKIRSMQDTNTPIVFNGTLGTCQGLIEEWTGGTGKRNNSDAGLDTNPILQAAAGFTPAPYASYWNQTLQKGPTAAPTVGHSPGGNCFPGRHYVAYTWVDYAGNESPLSPSASVDLTNGGDRTITVTLPARPLWAKSYNLYMTPAALTWAPGTVYGTAAIVMPTTPNDWAYKCAVGGTSGGSEPAWTTAGAAQISDGATVKWTRFNTDYDRRLSGFAKNHEFWQVATGVTSTTPTISVADNGSSFRWAGVPFHNTGNLFYDQHGAPDVMAPAQATTRANGTAYVVGDVVVPSGGNGHVYRCIDAGTSAGSAPTFTTGTNDVITDGGVVWMESGATGTVTAGAHLMCATYTIGGVEYLAYPVTEITAGTTEISVGCPAGPSATARNFYMTAAGDTGPTATFKLVKTLSDNTTFYTTLAVVDGSLGAALNFGTNVPYQLPTPRSNSQLLNAAFDCNGNSAGNQGADVAMMVRGQGLGGALRGRDIKPMGYNVIGLAVGYPGEDTASTDLWIEGLEFGRNQGTSHNCFAGIAVYTSDISIDDFNVGATYGQSIGVYVRTGSGGLLKFGGMNTHTSGANTGVVNWWVDQCTTLMIECRPYTDNVENPWDGFWLRPLASDAMKIVRLSSYVHTNTDVPWVVLDGGVGGGTGVGVNMLTIADMIGTGWGGGVQQQAPILCLNGYPNGYGLAVRGSMAKNTYNDKLIDSDLNHGITVSPDYEEGNLIATQATNPSKFLSEQHIAQIALGNGVSTIVVPHNCRAAPKLVLCMPTWQTTYRCTVASRTASQVTIDFGTATPDANQTVDVFLKTLG